MHVFSAPAEVTTFGIMEGVGQFLLLTRIFCTFRSYARSLLQWFTMPISFLLQKLNRNLFLENLPNLNGQNNSAPYPGETFCSGHCKVVFALVSVTVQTATDLETSYYQWLSKKFQNKLTSNNKWRITWLEDFPSLQEPFACNNCETKRNCAQTCFIPCLKLAYKSGKSEKNNRLKQSKEKTKSTKFGKGVILDSLSLCEEQASSSFS